MYVKYELRMCAHLQEFFPPENTEESNNSDIRYSLEGVFNFYYKDARFLYGVLTFYELQTNLHKM